MIQNLTPHPHACAVTLDSADRPVLVVALKLSYRLSTGAPEPAWPPPVLRVADEYSQSGALRFPADLAPIGVGTDVICHAAAHAPEPGRTTEMRVFLRVGPVARTLAVFGRRTWRRTDGMLVPSDPEPFALVPLGFEHAFGGASCEGNPAGKGQPAEEGAELPNIEDPAALLRSAGDAPPPASFSAVAPSWAPRRALAGTYDDAWRSHRAPLLPRDFQARYHQAGALLTPEFLRGGEEVMLEGMTSSGVLATPLPRHTVRALVGQRWVVPTIATVLLEPDEDRVELTLRFVVDVTGKLDRPPAVRVLERVRVALGTRSRAPGRSDVQRRLEIARRAVSRAQSDGAPPETVAESPESEVRRW